MKLLTFLIGARLASGYAIAVAPEGCKVMKGDDGWPAESVWEEELSNVVETPAYGEEIHPDYFVEAASVEDVQKAVNFGAKYNVRFSVINSGHDFNGR